MSGRSASGFKQQHGTERLAEQQSKRPSASFALRLCVSLQQAHTIMQGAEASVVACHQAFCPLLPHPSLHSRAHREGRGCISLQACRRSLRAQRIHQGDKEDF